MSKIKGNAAQKAAPVVNKAIDDANAQLEALATKYTSQLSSQVGKLQLDTAYKARDIVQRVPDANPDPVIKAMGRARKSEALTIIGATDANLDEANKWFAKNRKPGLQTMARAVKLVQFGELADSEAAKRFINKGSKADWMAATGQTPEPVKPEPVQGSAEGEPAEPKDGRDTERKNPTPEQVGNLKRLLDLLPALEAEYQPYGPECQKAVKAISKATEMLSKAAMNG